MRINRGGRYVAVVVVGCVGLMVAPAQAQAGEWHMAACVYEQSWVPECSDPWIVPAPTITYRVRKGDTLWRIAVKSYGGQEKAGHKWKQIAKANHLRWTAIYAGQTLRIPRALRNPATGQLTS